jgi:hypothetical protein
MSHFQLGQLPQWSKWSPPMTSGNIIFSVNQHLNSVPKTAALMEYRARIEHRVKTLTDVLVSELRVSPERSLRGGPRAARRAVTQLIKLGKSAQACDLFLKNRAAIIKYNLTQVKLEGASSLYIKKFCDVFFSGMTDTAKEFQKAFPDHHGCYSGTSLSLSFSLSLSSLTSAFTLPDCCFYTPVGEWSILRHGICCLLAQHCEYNISNF